MAKIHPAIAEHAMEESERLRGLLREAIHCCPDEQLRNEMKAALTQQADPKCRTCSDVGIIGHSEVCPECADTWGDQAELIVYRGVNQFGSDCHFGVESLARVWAGPKGAVERVTLKPVPDLSVVAARPAQTEPDHIEDVLAMVEPAPAQDEREAFEAEARKLLYVLDREAISGEYIVPDTENAWQLWRARPAQTEQQPIGWITEDYLTDKSATTYSPEVADRWRAKGWPVREIHTAPIAQAAQGDDQ